MAGLHLPMGCQRVCLQIPVFWGGPFSSPHPSGLYRTEESLGTKVVAASHLGRTGCGPKVG